jgi:IS30 family transposase
MGGIPNNQAVIKERREKVSVLLSKGIGRLEISKEINVTPSTISRDIQYLVSQSQQFLSDLAKNTLPFTFNQSLEGIRQVLKECWDIYNSTISRLRS